jgi:hypothetical protein
MCKEEIMNREDRREDKRQRKQAERIHNYLTGQLAPTTEEWIRGREKP